jgi:hypothetical protein
VGADLGHQERLVASTMQTLPHARLAEAVVVVPGVVQEGDARIEGRVQQAS